MDEAIGLLEAREALPELLACLRHPNLELRVAGAKALGAIGGPEAIAALVPTGGTIEWRKVFPIM